MVTNYYLSVPNHPLKCVLDYNKNVRLLKWKIFSAQTKVTGCTENLCLALPMHIRLMKKYFLNYKDSVRKKNELKILKF